MVRSAESPSGEPAITPDDDRLRLITRIAWMYYMEGLKQDEVAAALGTSRLRVNRLLAAARDEGLVRIEIASPYFDSVDIEGRLRLAFGLERVVLVPTPRDGERTTEMVGHAVGSLLNDRLHDGMTIGVHHGRTVHAMFNGLRPARMPGLSVVSLKGNLSATGRMIPYETVGRMALTLQARCYQIAAPSYARTVDEKNLFLSLDVVQSVLSRAEACDVAVITASRVSDDGGLVATGYMTADDAADLRKSGAVGAIVGVFVDAEGKVVDHDLNRRRLGIGLDGLKAIPEIILTGGGPSKVAPLKATLAQGFVHTLVTDEATATAILSEN